MHTSFISQQPTEISLIFYDTAFFRPFLDASFTPLISINPPTNSRPLILFKFEDVVQIMPIIVRNAAIAKLQPHRFPVEFHKTQLLTSG